MGPRPQLPWAAPAGASPPSFAHKRLEAGVGVVRGTVASSRLVRPAVQAEVAAGGDPEEVVVGIDNLCHELRWKKVFCSLTLGSLMLCCTILCSISAFGSLPGPDEKINAIKLFRIDLNATRYQPSYIEILHPGFRSLLLLEKILGLIFQGLMP